MEKGFFWRSSVRRAIKVILEQVWGVGDLRDVAMVPAGCSLLDASRKGVEVHCARVVLSVEDKRAYDRDPEALRDIVSRACLQLMRAGFEVRENPDPIEPEGMGPRVRRPNGRRRYGEPEDK